MKRKTEGEKKNEEKIQRLERKRETEGNKNKRMKGRTVPLYAVKAYE
jgi:hypothetical protein